MNKLEEYHYNYPIKKELQNFNNNYFIVFNEKIIKKLLEIQKENDIELGGYIIGKEKTIQDKKVIKLNKLFLIDNIARNPKKMYGRDIDQEKEVLNNKILSEDYIIEYHTHSNGGIPSPSDLYSLKNSEDKKMRMTISDNTIYIYHHKPLPNFYSKNEKISYQIIKNGKIKNILHRKYPKELYNIYLKIIKIKNI